MRENLRAAQAAAMTLNRQLNRLDGNSRAMLAEHDGDAINNLNSAVRHIVFTLTISLKKAETFNPRVKKQVDTPRIILAAHISQLMLKHLGIKANASLNGLFEEILKVVTSDIREDRRSANVTKYKEPSVHDLALKALRAEIIEQDDGGLMINPKLD
jgi:hypothetical protein